ATASLVAAGARPLSPRAPRVWGDEAAYFADPDGHVVAVSRHLGVSPAPTPPLPRMYHDLAHLWSLVSPPGNYAAEARHWHDALRATFATAAAHLEPGGLFVCAPDWYRDTFHGPRASLHGPRGDGGALTMLVYDHDPDPADTTMEGLHIFMLRNSGEVEVIED